MSGPLQGVRVVDLTHVLNGPFGTMLLAHMGAEVLKIEYGEGDRFRHSWMPPGVTRDSYEFMAVNENKKCITLNLKHPRGREIFIELVRKSDVVAENFSVGVMDRLGFSYAELKKINPRIIYAASRGYGETGPYAKVRAYAYTIQAITGWLHKSWEHSGVKGKQTIAATDELGGVSLALGICAALYHREVTGEGQKLDVSMQEATLGFMVSTMHTYYEKEKVGSRSHECADGHMGFHFPDMTDRIWGEFATTMGHPEAIGDPRFASDKARRENLAELEAMVSSWIKQATRQQLWRMFRSYGIPSAPVLSIEEVFEDEHIKAREAFADVDVPDVGPMKFLKPWIRFSDTPAALRHVGGGIGEHNAEVYGSLLGISDAELEELKRSGVV